MNELKYRNYVNSRTLKKTEGRMFCKITKQRVREDSENQRNSADIRDINEEIFRDYSKIPGFISGGTYLVEDGMSFTGYISKFPKEGEVIRFGGAKWFRSSQIEKIIEESKDVWTVWTINSVYRLEKLED